MNRAIKVKVGQLYDLYDVCEAHKVELTRLGGLAPAATVAAAARAEEDTSGESALPEEVERTLENVLEARSRRVEFESESEDGGSEWPGISDTEGM